ncbi:MAG: ATP-grasp domain-containing protein, partial [Pyrinomonadaceae bacterium]
RGTPYVRLDASSHQYDVSERESEYTLLFNRMSASAYLRGHRNVIFYTRNYLAHLEQTGTRVINGSEAFAIETSKASQLSLLASLGLPYPRARVFNCATEAVTASRDLKFPVVIKPNIGGRGAGIVRYDSLEALERSVDAQEVDLGIDSTALIQEFIPVRGGHINRVETLGGKYLYAIKIFTTGESFNLCPAEICQVESGSVEIGEMCLADAPAAGLKVEAYTPATEIIEAVERIVATARIDVGGIEYLIDDRSGKVMFYDINALSNFVADAPHVVGFDPHVRLVDYLEEEAKKCAMDTGSRFSVAG